MRLRRSRSRRSRRMRRNGLSRVQPRPVKGGREPLGPIQTGSGLFRFVRMMPVDEAGSYVHAAVPSGPASLAMTVARTSSSPFARRRNLQLDPVGSSATARHP